MRKPYTRRLSSGKMDMYLAIAKDYNAGKMTVAQICKKYGYTQRKSIYRVLDKLEHKYGAKIDPTNRGLETRRNKPAISIDMDIIRLNTLEKPNRVIERPEFTVIKKAESKLIN